MKKACILANGETPSFSLLCNSLSDCELFIACDGAAQTAVKLGFKPDVIVGDLDSLDDALQSHDALIHHVPDQHNNDLEKALDFALSQGVQYATLLGATGRRFDHALTNVYVLSKYAARIKIKLLDDYGSMWIAERSEALNAPIKTPVSFFALGNQPVCGLTLSGFQYPLDNATLGPGSSFAALNYLSHEQAHINHSSGILFIYMANQS